MVRVIINKHLRQAVEETAVRLSDSKRDGPRQVFVRKSISRLGVSFLAIELTSASSYYRAVRVIAKCSSEVMQDVTDLV